VLVPYSHVISLIPDSGSIAVYGINRLFVVFDIVPIVKSAFVISILVCVFVVPSVVFVPSTTLQYTCVGISVFAAQFNISFFPLDIVVQSVFIVVPLTILYCKFSPCESFPVIVAVLLVFHIFSSDISILHDPLDVVVVFPVTVVFNPELFVVTNL